MEYPSYRELDQFLESRIRALEAIVPIQSSDKSAETDKRKTIASHAASTVQISCPLCRTNHLLYQCPTFLKQTPSQRFDLIKKHRRCLNCFSVKHPVKDCTSPRVCKECHKRHHTLLHLSNQPKLVTSESSPSAEVASSSGDNEVASHVLSKTVSPNSKILLATARVRVYSPSGKFVAVRALLDQGSVTTLITESLAQRLRLPRIKRSVSVTGIGETQSSVRHAAQITIAPTSSDGPAYSTTALILKSLTKSLPS